MKILCVEDGSVDIDAIENGELKDGKCLVYRQGARPPYLLEIDDQSLVKIIRSYEKKWDKVKDALLEYACQSNYCQEILNLMNELEREND